MLLKAFLTTISCVLFIQMGLSEAIQKIIGIKLDFLLCPKCLTFWVTLSTQLICGYGIVESVAISFISAYLALWLSLLCDYLATVYNQLYENISKSEETDNT